MEVSIDSRLNIRSIDLGLKFAAANLRRLLAIAIIPVLVQVFAVSWHTLSGISAGNIFLVEVLNLLADTWLVASVVMLTVLTLREESIANFSLLSRAFQYLPKIFFSYVALAIVILSIVYMPPILLFAVFFIWAPYFCIVETFSKKDSEDDYEESIYENEEGVAPKVYWFERKALWDLGFARSVHLVGVNIAVTLQLLLILWSTSVIPRAIITMLIPDSLNWLLMASKVVVLGLTTAVVSAVVGVVFIGCLPDDARREVGIDDNWASKIRKLKQSFPRFHGQPIALSIVLLLSGLSTYFLYNHLRAATSPPDSISFSVDEVAWEKQRLKVVVRIDDSESNFRWLNDVRGWILVLDNPKTTETTSMSKEIDGSLPATAEKSLSKFNIQVSQVKYIDQLGNEASLKEPTLLEESATLVFYFEPPEVEEHVTAQLIYVSSHFRDQTKVGQILLPQKQSEDME